MEFLKKRISLILVLIMAAAPLFGGAGTVSAASDDMEVIVEKQIRAFAGSIDQKNMDDAAALALAGHGMS